jgi:hypothetical protein
MIESFMAGALTISALVVAMLFWRCKKTSGDRFFAFFAVAFLLLGIEHACIQFLSDNLRSLVYLIRLSAFLLIVYAIVDKNRKEQSR